MAAALLLLPGLASAQQDRANAEELFLAGKAAMANKDLAKACSLFQSSLNADFALGTLLNLAICHEESGRIASAWGEYKTLEERARQAKPPQLDRVKFAHDKAEALRPRLSRLRIVLAPEARATVGLTVKIDGVLAQPELFEPGLPVDAGKRTVVASAEGREDWTQTISVDDEKLKLDVTVPGLREKPKPVEPPPKVVVAPPPPADHSTLGYIVGGAGAASLAAGVVFGLLTLGATKDSKCSGCAVGSPEIARAEDAYHRANAFGWVSNITLAVGVVGLGVGTVLVFSSSGVAVQGKL